MRPMTCPAALTAALILPLTTAPVFAAAHLSTEQVKQALSAHTSLAGADMRGDDLSGLDFSGVSFKGADLSGASLKGDKLVGTDLSGAKLVKADLTGTWIMKARFDHADLHGATMQVVITSQGMDNKPETAASFVGADLSDTSATVHFSFDDMQGVNFTNSRQSVVLANQSMGLLRSEYNSANLNGANFTNAKLGRLTFQYAKLNNAIFRGADLMRDDFTGAYLNGADFTGANTDGAVFDGADLTGVKGLKIPPKT